jgi:hypothetical protein
LTSTSVHDSANELACGLILRGRNLRCEVQLA